MKKKLKRNQTSLVKWLNFNMPVTERLLSSLEQNDSTTSVGIYIKQEKNHHEPP